MTSLARAPRRVRPGWWWALGLSALLAGVIYIALNWYAIEDDSEWVGMQGEARTNPYLAMQRTVEAMGARTQVIQGDSSGAGAWDTALDAAPKNSTLILGDRRLVRMTVARVEQIRAWVRAGGNLILEAEQVKLDDPLLASYGIGHVGLRWTAKGGFVEKREKGTPKDDSDTEPENNDFFDFDAEELRDKDGKNNPLTQALPGLLRNNQVSTVMLADNASFNVNFRPYQNLRVKKVPDDALIIDDKAGTRLVQFRDGAGRVTAISNFDFMGWREIGKYDHAEFLSHMIGMQTVALSGADSKATPPLVLLALRDSGGGLWAWLSEHAWMVLWAFAGLLLAWIARVIRRFGPLASQATGSRLSLGEHLRALGHYLASQQGWGGLAHAARERFLKRLYRERPGLSRVDKTALLVMLEKLTGMGAARIERAMLVTVADKATFVETIRSLKAMEAMLDHHRQNGKTLRAAKT